MMQVNPLSPFTYYRRHKGRALMLTALLALAVMGLYLLVGLIQESYVTPNYTVNRYLSKFSLVQPDLRTLDPTIVAQIRTHPDVAQVLPQNDVEITIPNVGGLGFYFRLLGLQEADMDTVLAQSGVTLVEGQLPQPRTNGVALSQEIATALDLEIGDTFDWTKDEDNAAFARYANIVSPLEVVGILSGDVRLGIVSYEYLDGHERYRDLARYGVLVIARPGREAAVDDFLQQAIRSSRTDVYTHKLLEEAAARAQVMLYALFAPIVLLVTAAVTLVIGAINQLAFMRRLPEFGTLHAVGRSRGWLARRLTLETAGLAIAGWVLGIVAAWGAMAALGAAVYALQGFACNPLQVMALLLVAPMPLVVIGFTLFAALRALARLDAVAIVERGELSLEESQPGHGSGRALRHRAAGLPRPLAVTTFYQRHSRRAATLIGAMALMIVGTASLAIVIGTVWNGALPVLANLSRTSRVSPKGLPLEAAKIAQVRTHPGVERAIPVAVISPLGLAMPLIRDNLPLETYGVTAEDMAYLVELYDLELAEGRLPHPNTNEIVIPWTAAKSRNLHVGDVIGDRDHPIYPDAPTLPSELVVSGIFAPAENLADDTWLSFMSLEFIDSYQSSWRADLSLVIVPKAGQKAVLDAWLESQVAGERRIVLTHDKQQAWFQKMMNLGLFTVSLMESIVALVAALALAGLNYIFVTQRQAEFGVLNALGLNKLELVWRVARENLFTTSTAWLFGLLGCAGILVYLQYGLYTPAGLRLDFFNPIPWLFTLPIPLAVVVASAGAITWALFRLDPVAVIERRQSKSTTFEVEGLSLTSSDAAIDTHGLWSPCALTSRLRRSAG
jgi:ABC-type lipoprotein release transport system permease subunit